MNFQEVFLKLGVFSYAFHLSAGLNAKIMVGGRAAILDSEEAIHQGWQTVKYLCPLITLRSLPACPGLPNLTLRVLFLFERENVYHV